MTGTFIEAEITTSESQLIEEATEKLKELIIAKGIFGWEPKPASLEMILLEVLAPMAVNAAVVASTVLDAVFVQFGVQFVQLAFNEGSYATGTTKWTVEESGGVRQIPQGTQIEAGGQGYYVETETEVKAHVTSVSVRVVALEKGIEGNSVSGVAQQVNPLSYVTEVQFEGETSGGAEEESAEEYRNRLVTALELQAPRPITAANYSAFVLQVPEGIMPVGQVIGRATAIDGYNGATNESEAKVTSGSEVMTEVQKYEGITVGTEIVGTGVPKGTVVAKLTSVEKGKKELTMSAKATESPAKKAYKFIGSYENERYVTTFVTNKAGEKLSTAAKEDLEKWLKGYREINFETPIADASYNKVYVKAKIHVLPEYTSATVKAQVETAIKNFLSPETWGNPLKTLIGDRAVNTWLNYVNGVRLYATVRYNSMIEEIGAVPGVGYVWAGSGGLEIGLEAGTKGTSDLAMVGPAPLPEATEVEVKVE